MEQRRTWPGDNAAAWLIARSRYSIRRLTGQAQRRRASSCGTYEVWPAASRAFHSSIAAVSSASSSPGGRRPAPGRAGAGSRPPAPRLRPGRPGGSPHTVRHPGRARLARRPSVASFDHAVEVVDCRNAEPDLRQRSELVQGDRLACAGALQALHCVFVSARDSVEHRDDITCFGIGFLDRERRAVTAQGCLPGHGRARRAAPAGRRAPGRA